MFGWTDGFWRRDGHARLMFAWDRCREGSLGLEALAALALACWWVYWSNDLLAVELASRGLFFDMDKLAGGGGAQSYTGKLVWRRLLVSSSR